LVWRELGCNWQYADSQQNADCQGQKEGLGTSGSIAHTNLLTYFRCQ